MKYFIFFVLCFLNDLAFSGGVAVGNGGVVARCGLSDQYITLDYLLTYNLFDKSVRPIPVDKNTDSLLRISKLIKEKLPKISSSFEEFVSYLHNESDFTKPYVWVRVYDDNIYLTDDQKIDYIPAKCRLSSVPQIQFYQAVIRTKSHVSNIEISQIVFYYSHNVFSNLKPLQVSFIRVHEWLWNFTSDIHAIRKLNFFLHSNLFDEYSKEQTAELLKKWGLNELL